jgi:hypothetical protein
MWNVIPRVIREVFVVQHGFIYGQINVDLATAHVVQSGAEALGVRPACPPPLFGFLIPSLLHSQQSSSVWGAVDV